MKGAKKMVGVTSSSNKALRHIIRIPKDDVNSASNDAWQSMKLPSAKAKPNLHNFTFPLGSVVKR